MPMPSNVFFRLLFIDWIRRWRLDDYALSGLEGSDVAVGKSIPEYQKRIEQASTRQ